MYVNYTFGEVLVFGLKVSNLSFSIVSWSFVNFLFRLIINTKSNLLLYNFESVAWDYNAPVERETEYTRKASSSSDPNRKSSHAFTRAQSALRSSKDLYASRFSTNVLHEEHGTRVRSAPVRKADAQGIQRHISRIQSAVAVHKQLGKQKTMNSKGNVLIQKDSRENCKAGQREIRFFEEERVRNAWETVPNSGLVKEKSELIHQNGATELNQRRSRVIARSRSAPAHRVRSLPRNERGFTTSSEVNVKVWENRFTFKEAGTSKTKLRPCSASVTAMQHPVETHSDLKLKTFYQQLQFERLLAGRD